MYLFYSSKYFLLVQRFTVHIGKILDSPVVYIMFNLNHISLALCLREATALNSMLL